MKCILIFISIFYITTVLNSQTITINDADMPISNIYTVSKIANITFNPDETGTDYVWDFSFLEYDTQLKDTFFSVTDAPYVYQYAYNNPLDLDHKATVVKNTGVITNSIPVIDITDNYDYFRNSSNIYVKVGSGSTINNVPTVMKYDNVEYITTNFPLQIGDTNSSISISGNNIPNIGYYGQTVRRTNLVDGFGLLKTPYGEFETVRVKSIINIRDTIYYDDYSYGIGFDRPVSEEYNWYGDNQNIPLLTINSSAGNNYSATYKDSLRTTKVNKINIHNFTKIYPTITSDKVNIELASDNLVKYSIRVFSKNGTLLFFKENLTTSLINKSVISLSEITNSSGIYFIVVTKENKINVEKVIYEKL